MENLDQMRSDGWAHRGHPEPSVASAVELSLQSPFSGRSALRLLSWSNDSAAAAMAAEAPSILIQTAPVPVRTGDIARISGWVRVPEVLQHSEDGLMIYDNFGGLPLADRWQQTVAWQRFTLYRVVTRDEPLTVTFALSGLGEAWLDDVTIDLLR